MAGSKRRSRTKKTTIKDNTFGMPTLLRGEDAKAFHKLSERINKTVKPADALEEMWVADVVHLQWELQRLQECKAQFIRLKHEEGYREVVITMCGEVVGQQALTNRKLEVEGVEEAIEKAFEHFGFTSKTVSAQTMVLYLDEIERLDRMVSSAEARRNNAIREVRFHRDALARGLRRACEVVEDAEYTEIPAPTQARPAAVSDRKQIEMKANPEEAEELDQEEEDDGELIIGFGDD